MAYRLRNRVIKNPEGKVKFKRLRDGGYEHYHIGVWLEADTEREMDHVDHVEYVLHPTFPNRERTSYNRGNDFSITFWSWGTFTVEAHIHFAGRSGKEPQIIRHDLAYELPPDSPDNYIEIT